MTFCITVSQWAGAAVNWSS